jgi:hypothetical protein
LIASWRHDGLWRTAAVFDPPKSPEGHQVRYLGKVRTGRRIYRIYFDQNANPETKHGHEDLVVTTTAGKFLGFYEVTDPELEPLRVEGADVLFNSSKAYGDRIHFGPDGPPPRVFLNGNYASFGRPSGSRKDSPDRASLPEPGPRIAQHCRR